MKLNHWHRRRIKKIAAQLAAMSPSELAAQQQHQQKKASRRPPHRHAKTLDEQQLLVIIDNIWRHSRMPERDVLMVLLTFLCGLRAQEVAMLEYHDVVDASGKVAANLQVSARGGKYCKARSVPMPEYLQRLITCYLAANPKRKDRLFWDAGGCPIQPNAVAKQLSTIYRRAGFVGVSSHSGRRSYGTRLAQQAGGFDCSLRDTQMLLGHADISTTEAYVEASPRQAALAVSVFENALEVLSSGTPQPTRRGNLCGQYELGAGNPFLDGILYDDTEGMTVPAIARLAGRGLLFMTAFEVGGGAFCGYLIAASWEVAEQIAFGRGLDEVVHGRVGNVVASGAYWDHELIRRGAD